MRRFAVIGLGGFGQKRVIVGMGQGSEASETEMAKIPQEQDQP